MAEMAPPSYQYQLRSFLHRGARWVGRRAALAPGRYGELLERYARLRPATMLEVGVWRGDRSELFLRTNSRLREYVGFDLFEEMTPDQHDAESMGNCYAQALEGVRARLEAARAPNTKVELVRGDTTTTLPEFAARSARRFDFAFLDGGHSLSTVESDWNEVRRLLAPGGTCIFDDYYLERDDAGPRRLIEALDPSEWNRDFFQTVDKTEFGNYITMVSVSPRT